VAIEANQGLQLLALEVFYNLLVSHQGIFYPIALPEPGRNTATAATIADGIKMLLTPHNGMR